MEKKSSIEIKMEGTFLSKYIREFLKNSAHFPVTNLVLESLVENSPHYFFEPDPYILLFTALTQAFALTWLRSKKIGFIFWGNLVGPLIYVLIEAPLEGNQFFSAPQHQAYWYFSIAIGLFQFLKEKNFLSIQSLFEVFENLTRTLIPLCMYILFEAHDQNFIKSLPHFLEDPAHIFLCIVLFSFGLLIGTSEAQNSRTRKKMKALTFQLKDYSSWSLGKHILNQAVEDENIFKIKRVQRTILFLDIRGFTKWSEKESPEDVVKMLNEYYLCAENLLKNYKVLKTKYTADEIMIVFDNIDEAIQGTILLKEELNAQLSQVQLTVGGGLHFGSVVEGLIGSENHKLFDVMGDNVNTAKRLCESAKGNEILISQALVDMTKNKIRTGVKREVVLKGKENTYMIYPLISYHSTHKQ